MLLVSVEIKQTKKKNSKAVGLSLVIGLERSLNTERANKGFMGSILLLALFHKFKDRGDNSRKKFEHL